MKGAVFSVILCLLIAATCGQMLPSNYNRLKFCGKRLVKKYNNKDVKFDRCRRVLDRDGKTELLQVFWKKINNKNRKALRILIRAKTTGYIALGPGFSMMVNPNTTPVHRAVVAFLRGNGNGRSVLFREFNLNERSPAGVTLRMGGRRGKGEFTSKVWVAAQFLHVLNKKNPPRNIDAIFALGSKRVVNNAVPYHDKAGVIRIPTGFPNF